MTELQNLCLSFVRNAKGNAAVDYIQSVEASGSDQIKNVSKIEEPKTKKRRSSKDDNDERVYSKKHMPELWKEKYFQLMSNNDERLCNAKIRKIELESYHLLLQNIDLEKSMGLQAHEIYALRSEISPNLAKIPSYLTKIVLEDDPMTNTNESTDEADSFSEIIEL